MKIDDVSPTFWTLTSTFPRSHQSASGRAQCVSISKDGTKVYLGGWSGVWVSEDGGETLYHPEQSQPGSSFGPVSGALMSPNVYDLLISPANNNTVLAATGRDAHNPSKAGIYLSEDGAKTWKLVHQFFSGANISDVGSLVVAPDNTQLMFAAGGFAVGISTDGGISWINKMLPKEADDRIWYVLAGPQEGSLRRVFAIGTHVWYSEDGGITWKQDATTLSVPFPSDGAGFSSKTVAIHPTNSSIIYIIKRFGDEHVELWRGDFSNFASANKATWKALPSIPINYGGVTPSGCTFIIPHVSNFNGLLYLMASDTRTAHISFGEPSSTNDWKRIDINIHLDPHGMGLTPEFEHAATFPGSNFGRIVIVNDGGLYYSVDGMRTWEQGKKLSTLTILNTAILPEANKKPALCMGTTDNSGFFSFDGGENWKTQHYRGGDNDWCFSDPLQPSRLIVFGPRDNFIYLYTNRSGNFAADGTVPTRSIPEPPRIPDPHSLGWQTSKFLFYGENGIIYAVDRDGRLLFYRDINRDGTGDVSNPSVIGLGGWQNMKFVFYGYSGIIYAVPPDGRLLFYRDNIRNGTGDVSNPSVIGLGGWQNMKFVFSGGFRVSPNGNRALSLRNILHHLGIHLPINIAALAQIFGYSRPISLRKLLSELVASGIIYAVNSEGWLLFYRDNNRDGTGDVANPIVFPKPSGKGTLSWNGRSNYANMGYRPVIVTIRNSSPIPNGDFITIHSDRTKTVLLRTFLINQINSATDWVPNTPDSIAFQEGPDLPDLFVNIVQSSGGHHFTAYYACDLSTPFNRDVALSGSKQDRLWKWRGNMTSWNLIVPVPAGSIGPSKAKRFFVDPYRPSQLYVLDTNHIYRSDNGGQSWVIDNLMEQALTEDGAFPFVIGNTTNPEDSLVRDMAFDPSHSTYRFAAGPAGVFYTSDGISWKSMIRTAANPMHPTTLAYDYVTNPWIGHLYVSTSNRGLLRITIRTSVLSLKSILLDRGVSFPVSIAALTQIFGRPRPISLEDFFSKIKRN